ncbi:hypothetical protein L6164_028436 [Bauhinia variegata]|uniref:Uncharacterized protein n=1 Tax=Bauhinia variegata TaxID=167791 RepID=A0ACB9L6V1_BAUVA|nr:hypothetical protein L6164_028436 [Bauhinia variegata]
MHTSDEYENGVEEFLEFARENVSNSNGRFYCPCVKCVNERLLSVGEIREDLADKFDLDMDDQLEDMIYFEGLHECPICGVSHYKQKDGASSSDENESALVALTREKAYEQVSCINVTFGKTQKQKIKRAPWKKRSIFFDPPYWHFLDVRHNIDGMHVEKNMCDSLIGTYINIQGQRKCGVNAHLDC